MNPHYFVKRAQAFQAEADKAGYGRPRNEHPAHRHTAEEEEEHPWTADALSAHLRVMHGLGVNGGESMASLSAIHALLEHGALTSRQQAAPEPGPRRRYSLVAFGKLRTSGNPEDKDLYLESDHGTTIVCFTPADLTALRAAVAPEDEGLRALQDIWQANLSQHPGARLAVEAGHAAGYKLGVTDMEAVHASMSQAEAVQDWLERLADQIPAGDDYTADRDRASLVRVLDLLQRRIDAEREARHVS